VDEPLLGVDAVESRGAPLDGELKLGFVLLDCHGEKKAGAGISQAVSKPDAPAQLVYRVDTTPEFS
jgi:hypothetical protein